MCLFFVDARIRAMFPDEEDAFIENCVIPEEEIESSRGRSAEEQSIDQGIF